MLLFSQARSSVSSREQSPSEHMLGVSEFPWIGRMEKVCPLQLISKPLGDPGTPLPGPLFDFPTPGLWAARWGGSVAGSSGQPAKQREAQLGETALGAGPGGRERGNGCGRGGGVGPQPGPLGGRTHCQLGTHSKAQLCWARGAGNSEPGLRGDDMSEVPAGSCPAQEARPQML